MPSLVEARPVASPPFGNPADDDTQPSGGKTKQTDTEDCLSP
jgi:hypothetical protein